MRRAWIVPLLLVALASAVLSPASASGHQIFLTPSSGLPGISVTVQGSGFLPPSAIAIHWDSQTSKPLAMTSSNQNGTFAAAISVPGDAKLGQHDVIACDVQQFCVSAPFTVTAPTPPPTPPPTPKITPTPKPTAKPTAAATPAATPVRPTPGSTVRPGPTASLPGPIPSGPITAPPPTGSLLIGSVSGAGLIGEGILGAPATIQVPGLGPQPEGFQPRCEAPPQATIIDFDDSPAGTDLRDAYADLGVRLEGGAEVGGVFGARDEALVPFDATGLGTISVPNGLQVRDDPSEGRGLEALRVTFDSPQRLIGVYLGSERALYQEVRLTVPDRELGSFPDPNTDLIQFSGPATITNCMLLILPPEAATTEVLIRTSYHDQDLLMDRLFFSDDPTYSLPALVEGSVSLVSPRGDSEVDVGAPITLVGSASPIPRPGDTAFRRVERVLVTYVNAAGSTVHRYAEVVLPVVPAIRTQWRLEGVSLPTGSNRISLFASGTGVVARGTSTFTGFTLEELRRDAEGTFDLQPIGMEVTQGIRGPIGLQLAGTTARETAVHVAGKATTVRAYGRLVWGADGPPPGVAELPTDAWLFGFSRRGLLPGSPLRASPAEVDLLVRAAPLTDLAAMRADASSSWNFDLPLSWTEAGSIDLMLWVNPPGASHWREGFDSDQNDLWLRGVRFSAIDPREVVIYATDFHWYNDGPLQRAQPTLGEITAALDYWERSFPIPYGGLQITEFHLKRWALRSCSDLEDPVRDVCSRPQVDGMPVWQNSIIVAEQAERISRTGEVFIPLLFSPSSPIGCSGRAGIGSTPLFHAGACGATVAQEAAHSLGLIHLSNAHSEELPARNRYAADHAELEAGTMGWDVARRQPILPGSASATHAHDFMSYGGGLRWVSIDTWERVAAALMARNLVSPRDAPAITPGRVAPGTAGDVDASLVGWTSTPFGPSARGTSIPGVAAAGQSILVSGVLGAGDAIAEVRLIAVDAPPARLGPDGDIEIAILAADGTELLVLQTSATLDTHGGMPAEFHALVPALPDAATVRVHRGEGEAVTIATGVATSLDDMRVPDAETGLRVMLRTPTGIGILSPRGSIRFDSVVLGGGGDLTYAWHLDGQAYSDGSSVFLGNLQIGRHELELRVSSEGKSASSTVELVVDEDSDGDGLVDSWEARVGLDPAVADDAAADADADGLQVWLEQSLGSDPRTVDSDGDGYADGVEFSGGSDLADPSSIPMALHGALGEPAPRLEFATEGPGDAALPLVAAAVAAGLALGALALLFVIRRRSGDPAGRESGPPA